MVAEDVWSEVCVFATFDGSACAGATAGEAALFCGRPFWTWFIAATCGRDFRKSSALTAGFAGAGAGVGCVLIASV